MADQEGKSEDSTLYFLEFRKNEKHDSISRRLAPSTGEGTIPYMDVMTVSTGEQPISRHVQESYGSYNRLLVEPVSIPQLQHTGLKTDLIKNKAEESTLLFYPNGAKKIGFRDMIRVKLQE